MVEDDGLFTIYDAWIVLMWLILKYSEVNLNPTIIPYMQFVH